MLLTLKTQIKNLKKPHSFNTTVMITVVLKECVAFLNSKFEFLMLVALAISHLLMPAALTLPDYLWLVRNINKNNKNCIN